MFKNKQNILYILFLGLLFLLLYFLFISIKKIQLISIGISDLIALSALFVSLFTLFFSLYFQFIKPPSVKIGIGDISKLYLMNEGNIVISFNLTFFNDGARWEAIYKIDGNLRNLENNEITKLFWQNFVKEERIGGKGKPYKIWNVFDGRVVTIIVPGYQAITKNIQFFSTKKIEVNAGTYEITLFAHMLSSKNKTRQIKYLINLSENDCKHVLENCIANESGLYTDSLEIRRS